MTIGKIVFDTTFSFNNDDSRRLEFEVNAFSEGIVKLLIILIVLIAALSFSLSALFESGSGPPRSGSSTTGSRLIDDGVLPSCFDHPDLSVNRFNETLHGRLPVAGDLPRLRFEDFCYVPVF